MLKDKIRFIAADMDGTLLDQQGQLPEDFFDVYRQLEQEGILFSAASGRQFDSLKETFSPIKDTMIFIAENGTLVMHKDKELYSCTMDHQVITDIITLARTIPEAHTVLCGKKSAYIETQNPQALDEIKKYYHRCEFVTDLTQVKDDFIKVAICHFDGSEKHLNPILEPVFGANNKVVISAKYWLDVMNINASKGAAIKHLQKTLGFTFEQTMSFGDYFNDIEMLQESHYAYAMENAPDEIKRLARFQAPNHNEGGVCAILKQYLADTQ